MEVGIQLAEMGLEADDYPAQYTKFEKMDRRVAISAESL